MLVRQSDPAIVNHILNHPSVLPWVIGNKKAPLDASPVIANTNNIVLACEWCAFIFAKMTTGIYELHTCVLPEGRGQGTISAGHEAMDWMFSSTDAAEIVTRVPRGNIAGDAAMRALGIAPWFKTKPIWPLAGGNVPMTVYRLALLDWITLAQDRLRVKGKEFHRKLIAAGGAVDHEDDPLHDVYVGAALGMIDGGQIDKGIIAYDLWASLSGYDTISVVSRDPLLIDIGTGVVMPETGEFRPRLAA